jgi:SAM-dependent methyltransferase
MERMESEAFWELYWEMRLQELQNLGKREAILAISRLIRRIAPIQKQPLRLLELGSGEGQIIGPLVEGHSQLCSASESIGIDYLPTSVRTARRAFPSMKFIEGDFTDQNLLEPLGLFDIVILVNAMHEVFSATFSDSLGEVDVSTAKHRVEQAFSLAAARIRPGGYLVLFDGLEPPGDPRQKIRLRFLNQTAFEHFETFAREYHPFHIGYRPVGGTYTVELSRHDFARYITKSIFLGKRLWQTERLESYQYYTEPEFRAAFAGAGLEIQELRTLTVDEEKWRRSVEILTPGVRFPEEHILIIAKKAGA